MTDRHHKEREQLIQSGARKKTERCEEQRERDSDVEIKIRQRVAKRESDGDEERKLRRRVAKRERGRAADWERKMDLGEKGI